MHKNVCTNGSPKTIYKEYYLLSAFYIETIVLIRVYHQQFPGNIYIYVYIYLPVPYIQGTRGSIMI